jgi:hypothetical protein
MDDFNTVARVAATGCLVPHPIPPPTARASLLHVGIKDGPSHVRPRGIVEGQILEEVELRSGSGPSRGVRVRRVLGRCRVECERRSSALLLIGMGPRRGRWRRGPGGIEGEEDGGDDSGFWKRCYVEAHRNPHNLWVRHWNCVSPEDATTCTRRNEMVPLA